MLLNTVRFRSRRLLRVSACAVYLIGNPVAGSAQTAAASNDARSIQAMYTQMEEETERDDYRGVIAHYSPSAQIRAGVITFTPSDLEQIYARMDARGYKYSELRGHMRILAITHTGTKYIVRIIVTAAAHRLSNGVEVTATNSISDETVAKVNGTWKIMSVNVLTTNAHT